MNGWGFLRDENGDRSMGRLLALMAQIGGSAIIVAGIVGFFAGVFMPMTDAIGQSVAMTAVGAGIDIGAQALKNWAKHEERR